jgi:hypothetical protein
MRLQSADTILLPEFSALEMSGSVAVSVREAYRLTPLSTKSRKPCTAAETMLCRVLRRKDIALYEMMIYS